MKPVFIASEPNSQEDDRKIAKQLLFKPSVWKKGESEKQVAEKLKQILDSKYCFTYDTGRAALYSIFQAIGVREEDEVIIQAFTCLAVPLPIKWAKAKPIYVDIDSKTYNPTPESISKAITPKTRAVIVQHTFGIPAKIDEIKQIIDLENQKRTIQNKIYLVEDLAHSLGSKYKNKKLGTYCDVAMLSFGQEKVISCTQGGAVITNDNLIEINLKKQYGILKYLNTFQIKRNILHPLFWNTINKTYYFPPVISIGKILILKLRFLGLLKSQANPSRVNIYKPEIHKLSNAQSMILLNQLGKLDKFTNHRKEITNIYETKFNLEFNGLSLLRYPVISENRVKLISKLKANRIIPGNWYNSPIHPIGTNLELYNYKPGSCLNAERASTQIVNIPTGINVEEDDAKRIVQIFEA